MIILINNTFLNARHKKGFPLRVFVDGELKGSAVVISANKNNSLYKVDVNFDEEIQNIEKYPRKILGYEHGNQFENEVWVSFWSTETGDPRKAKPSTNQFHISEIQKQA